jgi:hypothetical protein
MSSHYCAFFLFFLLFFCLFFVFVVVGWKELLLLFFHGKRIFPDPDFLRSEGIQVIQFDLYAGQCLYASGDMAHFGMNLDKETVSLSTNVITEEWLKVGESDATQNYQHKANIF